MSSPVLTAHVAGIGFWTRGLPSWESACAYVNGSDLTADAPNRPSPQLLAANERRRAPDTVAVALEVALAACVSAAREPSTLPSVFASHHGDLSITDYMCETLANDPRSISPTRFHNSVHNAAAGYWSIGAGALTATTAISAGPCSFAQGLLDALAQLASGSEAVLLVGYDGPATGPLGHVSRSEGLLGGALVLSRDRLAGAPTLRARLGSSQTPSDPGDDARLSRLVAGNAMRPMLPLFEALAAQRPRVVMAAGPESVLSLEIDHA